MTNAPDSYFKIHHQHHKDGFNRDYFPFESTVETASTAKLADAFVSKKSPQIHPLTFICFFRNKCALPRLAFVSQVKMLTFMVTGNNPCSTYGNRDILFVRVFIYLTIGTLWLLNVKCLRLKFNILYHFCTLMI